MLFVKVYGRAADGRWDRANVPQTTKEVFTGFVVEVTLERFFYVYNLMVPIFINSVLGLILFLNFMHQLSFESSINFC